MSYRSVLRNRHFFPLWVAQLISRLGKIIHEIALVWVVYEVTGSPTLISLIVLANIIPNMIVAVPAGVVVDWFNRKYLIVATEFASALAVLSIPLVGRSHFLVPTVVGVAVVLDLLEAVFVPARQALVPNVVPESDLDTANSLSRLTISTTQMLYVVGGLIVGLFGTFTAFYLNSVSYVISGLVLLAVPTEAGIPDDGSDDVGFNYSEFLQEVKQGVAFIRTHATLPWALLLVLLSNFSVAPVGVVLPFFADVIRTGGSVDLLTSIVGEATANGSVVFAALYGALFVGIFLGSVLVDFIEGTVERHRGKAIIFGVTTMGMGFLVAAVIPSAVTYPFTLIFAAIVAGGAGQSVMQIAYRTFLQTTVPDDKRGRVFSLVRICSSVGTPLSVVLAAPMVQMVGSMATLGSMGALLLLSSALMLFTPLFDVGSSTNETPSATGN
jgi:MFS family permease